MAAEAHWHHWPGWWKWPSPLEDHGGGEEKEEKHHPCGCSWGRMGTSRFDLDSALAPNPRMPLCRVLPPILTKGHCPFFFWQRKPWLGAKWDFEGQEFPEGLGSLLTPIIQPVPAGKVKTD